MRGKQDETTQGMQIQPLSPCSVLLLSFNTNLYVIWGYPRTQERRDDDLPFLSCLMSRLTTPPRDANSGLDVWDSKKYCPCWLSLQVHRMKRIWQLGCFSFSHLCWRKGGPPEGLTMSIPSLCSRQSSPHEKPSYLLEN